MRMQSTCKSRGNGKSKRVVDTLFDTTDIFGHASHAEAKKGTIILLCTCRRKTKAITWTIGAPKAGKVVLSYRHSDLRISIYKLRKMLFVHNIYELDYKCSASLYSVLLLRKERKCVETIWKVMAEGTSD